MLSNQPILYGIHSLAPYALTDGLPYGLMKVIGSANLELTTELDKLYAGSNKFPWAAESKTIETNLTAKVKALPGFLFALFLGATVTESGENTAGAAASYENFKGTSVKTSITTVAVSVTNKANAKFTKYLIKAVSASTVDIYAFSDIDAQRGVDMDFVDDSLKVTAAPVTITTGANELADLGLTLTGAASVALVAGDTASFAVAPPNTKMTVIDVGAAGMSLPNFGAILYAQKRATGEMCEIEAYNCVGGGLPLSLEEQAWSQPELKMSCLYSANKGKVFQIRMIEAP